MSRRVLPFLLGGLLAGCDHTTPLVPTNVAATSGDAQTDTVARVLPAPRVVTVMVEGGNPVRGVTVSWAAAAGQGSVSPAAGVTGAGGVATTVHTLGPTLGADTVTATVPVLAVTLTFVSTGLRQAILVATVPIAPNYGIHDTFVRNVIA